MITAWFKGATSVEDKERIEASVKASKHVLERLQNIMETDMLASEQSQYSVSNYDSPNWAYRQAHLNGYQACLKAYSTLLNLDQKDNTE